MKYHLILLLCIPFFISCGAEMDRATDEVVPPVSQPATGMSLFSMPDTANGGNFFSCSRCHSPDAASDNGVVRPGHHLENAYYRTSFKQGQLSTLREAVNVCRKEWMTATEYAEGDSDWELLSNYLKGLSDGSSTANLTYDIVQPPASLPTGNIAAGQTFFNSSCALCHGVDGSGGFATVLAGSERDATYIANKIRLSGDKDSPIYNDLRNSTAGGPMPFYSQDKISDQQIADVIAFIQSLDEPTDTGGNTGGGTTSGGLTDISLTSNLQTNCGSSNPKVGQTLTFNTRAHNVQGTATIVDDCTIRIDNFVYDGTGIEVVVYTGQNSNFRSGNNETISIDLLRSRSGLAFTGQSVVLTLPVGVSLNDFDSLSIWCIPFNADFGNGKFN